MRCKAHCTFVGGDFSFSFSGKAIAFVNSAAKLIQRQCAVGHDRIPMLLIHVPSGIYTVLSDICGYILRYTVKIDYLDIAVMLYAYPARGDRHYNAVPLSGIRAAKEADATDQGWQNFFDRIPQREKKTKGGGKIDE